MNFLYLYPTYEKAREAWFDRQNDLFKQGIDTKDETNLRFTSGSDEHFFRYVPIKVSIDLERLGFQTGIIYTYPLIEALIDAVKFELVQLAEYTLGAGRLEYGRRSIEPAPIQTPNAPAVGRTTDSGSTELGSEVKP